MQQIRVEKSISFIEACKLDIAEGSSTLQISLSNVIGLGALFLSSFS